jgi:hypothetical protein
MREKFKYIAHLISSDGQTVQREFVTYWSPKFERVLEDVARAAAVEAWYETGKRLEFSGVSAQLA